MPDLSTVVNMFFGADNNKVLYALIILVTLDYITGVCVAIKDKKLSSSIGAKGIINKVVIFIMVSLSHVVDSYLLSSGVALERITMELIQVDTGKVMKTWTDSGSISISLTNKPWYVTSGHRYQVKVTVTVYNTSGKSIETSEEVSSIVKF